LFGRDQAAQTWEELRRERQRVVERTELAHEREQRRGVVLGKRCHDTRIRRTAYCGTDGARCTLPREVEPLRDVAIVVVSDVFKQAQGVRVPVVLQSRQRVNCALTAA